MTVSGRKGGSPRTRTPDPGLLSRRLVFLITLFILLAGGGAMERFQELHAWLGSGTLEGGSVPALLCRVALTAVYVTLVVRALTRLLRTGVLVRRYLGLAAWLALPAVHWAGVDWYEVLPLEMVVAVKVGANSFGVSVLGLTLLALYLRWVVWRPKRSEVTSVESGGS